jgi:hypothetical protein
VPWIPKESEHDHRRKSIAHNRRGTGHRPGLALRLATDGTHIAIVDVNATKTNAVAQEVKALGRRREWRHRPVRGRLVLGRPFTVLHTFLCSFSLDVHEGLRALTIVSS